MKFEIKNRFTGAVQVTAEIECAADASTSIKLGLAVRWAFKSGADLSGADLSRAYLSRADLSGANLSGANLSRAYLSPGDWIVQGATRSDGYAFLLLRLNGGEVMIKAGCRYFTLAKANAHWHATRAGTPLGDETNEIINSMFAMAHVRGLVDDQWNPRKVAKKEAA